MYEQNKSRRNKRNFALSICPLCNGTGKTRQTREEANICNASTKGQVCPLCKGQGKVEYLLHVSRINRGSRIRKMRLTIRRPHFGRGGRPSLGRCLLFSMGMPPYDYVEGDMIRNSSLIPGYAHLAADDLNEREQDNCQENGQLYPVSENFLFLSHGFTCEISDELGVNLTIVTDSTEVLQSDPNLVGSISRGSVSYEHIKFPQPLDEPALYLPIIEPNQVLIVRETPASSVEDIYQYAVESSIDIKGSTGSGLALPDHNQLTSDTLTGVLSPEIFGQQNPQDITGLQESIEPLINTDIIGNTW